MGDAAALLAGAARRDPEAWAAPLPARLARRRSASVALATLAAEAGETDPRFSFEDGDRDREPDFWPEGEDLEDEDEDDEEDELDDGEDEEW
jgi:hypothetical protein